MRESIEFLKDEVRSGFYIPTAIKQAWATQLIILSEIDRICKKYDIQYFAEWGTLLGVVRHGGYVPWDDDFDIGMKRKDYRRFMEVAQAELPEGYAIHNYETKEDHWLFLSRVVNKNHICFDKEHLDTFYNFPYIATIDIFVFDYRYRDEKLEEERCDEVKRLIAVADGIAEGKIDNEKQDYLLREINYKYGSNVRRCGDARRTAIELYKIAEQQMARTPEDMSDRIVQLFPWGLQGSKGLPKEYYDEFVRLPFENTTIPVPAKYHKVLQSRYGNYMVVHKVWGGHDYPYFEGQRANLQKVADFKLPEFTFDEKMLRENQKIDKEDSLKNIAKECLKEMKDQVYMVQEWSKSGEYDSLIAKLSEMQQLAIDLGTLLENTFGEEDTDVKAIVRSLEQYCETIFELFEGANTGDAGVHQKVEKLKDNLCDVEKNLQEGVINKREVLFLPNCHTNWKSFEKYYNLYIGDKGTRVSVVPLPIMQKDVYGNIISSKEEVVGACKGYSEDLNVLSWELYDVSFHHPEIVYIQDPYDGENPCLTVPPAFYAENVQKYTDKLIYVPAHRVSEFGPNDTTDLYNMKHYVTAPGVVRSDEIIVQSENMKQRYLERFVQFAGDKTRDIWESKLKVDEPMVETSEHVSSAKKRILYCIGLNEISENQDIETLIANKIDIFGRYTNDIEVNMCTYPVEEESWGEYGNKVIEKTRQLIEKLDNINWCRYSGQDLKRMVEANDAYYGSPCVIAHMFLNVKKPVMIADYNL